jgi:peroxiredoxin
MADLPEMKGNPVPLSWLRQHFFDNADLKDKRLYITPDLDNKLSFYLAHIADTSGEGRAAFIQALFNKVEGDKGAHSAAANLTSLLFLNVTGNNREPFIQTLADWAARQLNLTNEQPVMAAKIKLASKVLPGMQAPEVTGEDPDDKTQKLLQTVKKNKLTLLIFWESDCTHCRKAMPEFIRLYQQYHAGGLEVFAASLDSDKNKWKQFIKDNHLNWLNILLPHRSTAHSDYFIQYTPTMVLIGSDGNIVHRFIDVQDLDKGIAEILGK